MKIQVVLFEVEHVKSFSELNHDRISLVFLQNDDEFLRQLAARGPAFTGMVDGVPVGCCGINLFWPGVGEAWMMLSPGVLEHKKELHWLIKTNIARVQKQLGLHRLQATVKADFDRGLRWMRALGFEIEGVLRGYGMDGSDYVMFARYGGDEACHSQS